MNAPRAYLDYNASAPLRESARAAVVDALGLVGNPSSVHAEGRAARAVVEKARRAVAGLAGAKPEQVVFTSGASEAAATLLSPDWRMGRAPVRASTLYVLAGDHPCLTAGGRFAPESIRRLPIGRDGRADLSALRQTLAEHDRAAGLPLVALALAHNETGVVQDAEAVASIIREGGGIFVLDAVQAAGRLSLEDMLELADFLILSGHKLGGPKGVGAIVAKSDLLMPAPLLRGGGQEKGHRSGTEALPLIAGFGAAAREAIEEIREAERMTILRSELESTICGRISGATIIGADAPARLPNTILFLLPGLIAETAQIAFDLEGVALSAGSACSSGKVTTSAVLGAMGYGATSGVRLSFGVDTGAAEIERFLHALDKIAGRAPGTRTRAA